MKTSITPALGPIVPGLYEGIEPMLPDQIAFMYRYDPTTNKFRGIFLTGPTAGQHHSSLPAQHFTYFTGKITLSN